MIRDEDEQQVGRGGRKRQPLGFPQQARKPRRERRALALARDRHERYFRANPSHSDREYLTACFNEAAYLTDALLSLRKQDFPGEFEVVVVDNNCTDDTGAVAARYDAVFDARAGRAVFGVADFGLGFDPDGG